MYVLLVLLVAQTCFYTEFSFYFINPLTNIITVISGFSILTYVCFFIYLLFGEPASTDLPPLQRTLCNKQQNPVFSIQ